MSLLYAHPPAAPLASVSSTFARHELHRAVDGDWHEAAPTAADQRRALVMGLAVVATLPAVSLLLAQWPEAPRALVAAIGSLPLCTLLVVALAWRTVGGEP